MGGERNRMRPTTPDTTHGMMPAMSSEILVTTCLAGWLVLTVLSCLRLSWLQTVRKYDVLGMMPSWGFFANALAEFRLLFRTVDNNGALTGWLEIDLVAHRTWHEAFWHPLKRVEKAFQTDLRDVARMRERGVSPDEVELSAPYRRITYYVLMTARVTGDRPVTGEFLIAQMLDAGGYDAEMLVVRSNFRHPSADLW
jgi:hypothetical protein